MASNQFADGKSKLIEPGHANYPDEWDEPCNSNWGVIDALVSGTTTINVAAATSAAPYITLVFKNFTDDPQPWLVANAGQNVRLLITGALAFNFTLLIPSGVPGFWFVDNQTTGAFTVTVKTNATSSTGPTILQGRSSIVYCDGTNVTYADNATLPPIATDTSYGVVTQGLLKTNCVPLDNDAKIPYQTDKYIISTSDPDSTQGSQDWLWMKV